ncbi:DUF2683 family protein [Candidatus Micrarchaeota archaeon]|nr:DUF2683 family protein [Candidatus Micrarchaeota archaeon]
MVNALVELTEHTNRIINIVKAKYGLNDKSEAINLIATQYEEDELDPPLRPEYVKKALRIMKQKPIYIGTIEDFKKRYER